MTNSAAPQATRDLRPAARPGLLPARGSGWLAGFSNMLGKELGEWFGTRRWLVQLLAWPVLITGAVLGSAALLMAQAQLNPELAAAVAPEALYALMLESLFQIGMFVTAVGAALSAQGVLIGEKQLGTAAWILSKPAARSAFVLAKLAANAAALLALAVALPSLAGYGAIWLVAGRAPDLAGFAAGVGTWAVHLLFYLALTLMLGTLLASRGPVLGIGMVFLFAGSFIPSILPIFPWPLSGLSLRLALGTEAAGAIPTTAFLPLLATIVWTMLFIVVALWRFEREEF
jgi:ABC-2 type transport system permease protein